MASDHDTTTTDADLAELRDAIAADRGDDARSQLIRMMDVLDTGERRTVQAIVANAISLIDDALRELGR